MLSEHRLLLSEEFSKRKRVNAAYSLNAFSKFLGLSKSTVSQVISGKRPLSRKAAKKILSKNFMTESQKQVFLNSAFGDDKFNPDLEESTGRSELNTNFYRMIAEWTHWAILGLAHLKKNRYDHRWVAMQLGIGPSEAKAALNRLFELGLIKKRGRGFYQTSKPLSVSTSSENRLALKIGHRQMLKKAEEALGEVETPLELFSSMVMAIDESKLSIARKIIKEFRRKMSSVLELGEEKRVYSLNVQLFPISKKKGTA